MLTRSTFVQIYSWVLMPDSGSQQPEGLFNPGVAPAGPELPTSACSSGVQQLQALLLPSKSHQQRISRHRVELHRDRHAKDCQEWRGHQEVNGRCCSRPLPGCQD